MSKKTKIEINPEDEVPTNWRPPGWRIGDDDPFSPEDGHTPENTEQQYQAYDKAGYYTTGGRLTEYGRDAKDCQTAEDVAYNRRALRDAWNTHPAIWRLASALTGVEFKVDPFWNEGARGMPSLERQLKGLPPETDGLAFDPETKYPLNWRGNLKKGSAPAAVNGPHSMTEKWLRLCNAYGQHDFVAAFVPDNGDAWFQQIGMLAQLVCRLGRVHCGAPPGIKPSSPRGASALLVWIPEALRDEVPQHTKDVLAGGTFRVPLWPRVRSGHQCAYIQPGAINREINLGLAA